MLTNRVLCFLFTKLKLENILRRYQFLTDDYQALQMLL